MLYESGTCKLFGYFMEFYLFSQICYGNMANNGYGKHSKQKEMLLTIDQLNYFLCAVLVILFFSSCFYFCYLHWAAATRS